MPTEQKEINFSAHIADHVSTTINNSALDEAITWIGDNLDPDDVFTEKKLLDFARNYDVDGIFEVGDLESWAEANGYVKETSF